MQFSVEENAERMKWIIQNIFLHFSAVKKKKKKKPQHSHTYIVFSV